MERMIRGRNFKSHQVVNHYTLSDRNDGGDRVLGQSKGFSCRNPTSSKFEWQHLLAQSNEFSSAGSNAVMDTTVISDCSRRFFNPSSSGITNRSIPLFIEPESGKFSGPSSHLDVGVPRDSRSVGVPRDSDIVGVPRDSGEVGIPRDSGNVGVSQDLSNSAVSRDSSHATVSRDSSNIGISRDYGNVGVLRDSNNVEVSQDSGNVGVSRDSGNGVPRDSGKVGFPPDFGNYIFTDGCDTLLNSSSFEVTLPSVPMYMEPDSGRFSGLVSLDSCNVYGCDLVLPSKDVTRGTKMIEEIGGDNTQCPTRLDSLQAYRAAASLYKKLGSQLKEFEMAFQKDAFLSSFNEDFSTLSPECFDYCGLDVRSTESNMDLPSMRSSDMKSEPLVEPSNMQSSELKSNPLVDSHSMQSSDRRIRPLGDLSTDDGENVNYDHTDDQKMARGITDNKCEKFNGSMATLEEHACSDLIRGSSSDKAVDRPEECSSLVHLKNSRLSDQVAPVKEQSNAHNVSASGTLCPKVQVTEVRGQGTTILNDQDAYKKQGCPLLENENIAAKEISKILPMTGHDVCLDGADGRYEQLNDRERLEMFPATNSTSCFDGVDVSLEQQLPPGGSLGNLLKRKDGNGETQQTGEDGQCIVVPSLLQGENVAKSPDERVCQSIANSDAKVSQLSNSCEIEIGDINRCLETNPEKVITTKSSPNKQNPASEKQCISSPLKSGATLSSVKRQKKFYIKKQVGPAPNMIKTKQLGTPPDIVKPCEPVLPKQNAVNFTKRLRDDPDSDRAHGQGDSLEANLVPLQVKNRMTGMLTKRSQDGPSGRHSQEVDSSKGSVTPAKFTPPHVPHSPNVKSHIPGNLNKESQTELDGAACRADHTPVTIEPTHVPHQLLKKKKIGKVAKRIQDNPGGASIQGGKLTKIDPSPASKVKTEKAVVITKRLGDTPDPVHGRMGDLLSDRATPARSEKLLIPSPEVNNQKPSKLNRPDLCGAPVQEGDSFDGTVMPVKNVSLENSRSFKERVHGAFLKFVKQLNENPAQWNNVMEQGKASLKCNICGSESEEFVDMKSLVQHTLTSSTIDCRVLHLGYHKALCLMMGWKSAMPFESSWRCETLTDAEASALKEDLIVWPPVAIFHNSSIQASKPDEKVAVTTEMLESFIKHIGFEEKTKISWGRPENQSIMVVKFNGTLSGFQEAERLHNFYMENKHGRVEFQNFTNSITRNSNLPAVKLENVLYGYLGIAADLDKMDLETTKHCLVKSKKEIQNIASNVSVREISEISLTGHDAFLDGADGRFEQPNERERLEMLSETNSSSFFGEVDVSLEQLLPLGDSLKNLLKRKDGNGDPQQTREDEQYIVVPKKKTRCSLLQDENVARSSNERVCQSIANSDAKVSQLSNSCEIEIGDINRCLETNPEKVVTTKSSPNKQNPASEKQWISSPLKSGATLFSVKRQKKVPIKKQVGPAPKMIKTKQLGIPPNIVKPCEPVLPKQNAVNFTKRLRYDPDSDRAHGQGDSLEANLVPLQMKNRMTGKLSKRSQDGPSGGHSQEVDSSKGNVAPVTSTSPHVPPPSKVKSQFELNGAACREDNTPLTIEPTHVPHRLVKKKKVKKFTKRIQGNPGGASIQEGKSAKIDLSPVEAEYPRTPGPRVKKKKVVMITKRLGDTLDPVHVELGDSLTDKATSPKSETLRIPSPEVKNEKPGKLNQPDPCKAVVQEGDFFDDTVMPLKYVSLENSKGFKLQVHGAFMKFVKQLNENPTQWNNVMEQGKAGCLKCNICGSNSEVFVDMKSLVQHTLTSPTIECRALHLGYHKALCLIMGWKSAMPFDNSWSCETLTDAEASALKEDLIVWPPVAIFHNSSIQASKPDEKVVVTTEMLESFLKHIGFGEKTKISWGRPENQSIMVVKFSGTLSGFQEAERLHNFYVENKHGRVEYQNFANGITRKSNLPSVKLENVLYGYLGIAEDLDKIDLETTKHCLVRSKKEIENIANAF